MKNVTKQADRMSDNTVKILRRTVFAIGMLAGFWINCSVLFLSTILFMVALLPFQAVIWIFRGPGFSSEDLFLELLYKCMDIDDKILDWLD